ncbi:hypothetical protein Elgi_52290 [Paenibacillus elgii]|nr:hypothetical protein Elgi_52290 [Paenibacillus elgii]
MGHYPKAVPQTYFINSTARKHLIFLKLVSILDTFFKFGFGFPTQYQFDFTDISTLRLTSPKRLPSRTKGKSTSATSKSLL